MSSLRRQRASFWLLLMLSKAASWLSASHGLAGKEKRASAAASAEGSKQDGAHDRQGPAQCSASD